MATDYSSVTEAAGHRLRHQANAMMYTRYRFATDLTRGTDVLEGACGAGQGLGLLAASARRVVGGDYTRALVRQAHAHYRGRIPLLCLDAHAIPSPQQAFDAVLLYEAFYYNCSGRLPNFWSYTPVAGPGCPPELL